MSLHDRIKEARKKKGLTQEQLGELIGVAKTTITGYEKNREPTAAKVGEIADALGVDVNFLFQDEVKELAEQHPTSEEMALIQKYRKLDTYGKNIIDSVLDLELSRLEDFRQQLAQAAISKPTPVHHKVKLPLFALPVGAGLGVALETEVETDTIQVEDTIESRAADFAVIVSGDSMEPYYHDGDILFVEISPVVEDGYEGIFILNGDGYFKVFGGNRLISYNDKYNDIKINPEDSFYTKGKVLGKA